MLFRMVIPGHAFTRALLISLWTLKPTGRSAGGRHRFADIFFPFFIDVDADSAAICVGKNERSEGDEV